MKFRHDINALRALAVTAVVLFHYKVDFVPGGFIGVDVFFVISGYLMTSIIMGRLAKNKFNIWEFYSDRAKRIVPGLMGVCFALLVAGYFFVEPATYHYLGSTSISALLFFSNFRFWQATSYFDPQSDVKWLLHTWSLSVEWQFYLAYPLLIMGLNHFEKTRARMGTFLWEAALLSLLLCLWSSIVFPSSAFYMLPQRAWELLAGGIVALQFNNSKQRFATLLLMAGSLMILVPVALYDQSLPWPYYWGLLPVLGTCFIIAANRPDAALFRNPFVQLIGRWSYSIYLWHWPVAVTAIYFGFTRTTPFKIASEIVIIALVLGIGGLCITFFQRFLKPHLAQTRFQEMTAGAGALALTVSFAGFVTFEQGLPNRRPESDQRKLAMYEAAAKDWSFPDECNGRDSEDHLRPCRVGSDDGQGVLVLGDSYAMQIFSRFKDSAKSNTRSSFTFLATPGCPPLTGIQIRHDRFNCNGFVDQVFRYAETQNFKRIVLVANWYAYFNLPNHLICFIEGDQCTVRQDEAWFYSHMDKAFDSLRTRLLEFKIRGIDIVIVGATPSGHWDVPYELAKRKFWGGDTQEVEFIDRKDFETRAVPTKSRLEGLAASVGAAFIDPLNYLCDDTRCPTVDKDGVPYYRDDGHFRSEAVKASRFQFLDDATGISNRLSALPVAKEVP